MLGQELVRTFRGDKGYKVIAWDRGDIDIAKEKEVAKKIAFTRPDVIINAAAYNSVDKCEDPVKSGLAPDHGAWRKEYKLAKEINGLAPGYLAKAAKKAKSILVHYSTDYVFDGQPEIAEPTGCTHSCSSCSLHEGFRPEVGFWEEDKPAPISNYGKTKLLGEKEVEKNAKSYYLIRTSKLFGKAAKNEGAKRSFFDVMLELGRKKEIHPVKSAKGGAKQFNGVKAVDEETSCFTYTPDLAKKTKEIIDSKKPYGIYHVTNSGPCTWYEAVLYLYKLAKIKTKVIPVEGGEFPRPAKRPFYSVLLNSKLNPMRDYREALKEYLGK